MDLNDISYGRLVIQNIIFPGKLRIERLNKRFPPKIPPTPFKQLIYNSIWASY